MATSQISVVIDHPVQMECCFFVFIDTLPIRRFNNLTIFDFILEIGFRERWIYDVFGEVKGHGEVDFRIIFAFFVSYLFKPSKLNDKIFGSFVHLHFFFG